MGLLDKLAKWEAKVVKHKRVMFNQAVSNQALVEAGFSIGIDGFVEHPPGWWVNQTSTTTGELYDVDGDYRGSVRWDDGSPVPILMGFKKKARRARRG